MTYDELKKEYRTNREISLKYLEQYNYSQAAFYLQRALKNAVTLAERYDGAERQKYIDQAMSIKSMLDQIGTGRANVPAQSQGSAKQIKEVKSAPDNNSPKAAAPSLESAIKELESLEGLANVKKRVMQIVQEIKINKFREEQGLPIYKQSKHMIFLGNPGTGKTTVARIMGDIFNALGLLSKGHLVEVHARQGLVGQYVGHTAQKTQEVIDSAMGGVLFIDEFYTLYKGDSGNDFGKEAIDVLLTAVENNRNDFVVILAGYTDEMTAAIKSNAGFMSRFNWTIEFKDYSTEELYHIFMHLCEKQKYVFAEDPQVVRNALLSRFEELKRARGKYFGNARDVRGLFEKTIVNQADRLSGLSSHEINLKQILSTLKISDLPSIEELMDALA